MTSKAESVIKDINTERDKYVDSFSAGNVSKLEEKCKNVSALKKEISDTLEAYNTVERNARKTIAQGAPSAEAARAGTKDAIATFFTDTFSFNDESRENAYARSAVSSQESASDIKSNLNSPQLFGYAESRPELKNCIDELNEHLDSLEELYEKQEDGIDTYTGTDQLDQIESSRVATEEELEAAKKALESGELDAAKKAVATSDQGFQLATGNLTQEQINDRARFEEQCFLITYMSKILSSNPQRVDDELAKGKVISKSDLEPDGFVNQLVHPEGYQQIFNITPAQLSSLTPSIELYKVFKGEDGKSEIDIPIVTNTYTTQDELNSFLNESTAITGPLNKSRGMGAGLKSMTLEFDGNNFFTAKRSIKSKLKLFFASFEELLRIREAPGDRTFSYIDLLMKTPSINDKSRVTNSLDANPQNYRLKVVLGWGVAKGSISSFYDQNAISANNLENSGITVQLIPVTHTINLGENGQVEVEIEYRAYIDSITSSVYSNILASKELYKSLFEYDAKLKEAKQAKCKSEDINAYKKEKGQEIDEKELDALKEIINKLDDSGALNYATIEKSAFSLGSSSEIANKIQITNGGSKKNGTTAKDKTLEDVSKAADSETKDKQDVFLPFDDDKNKVINFFFLSDLIKIAMDQIQTSLEESNSTDPEILNHIEQFKKIRIVLGPFVYYDNTTTNSTEIKKYSLGDIPISLNYFTEFFMSKTIKDGVSEYTLYQFLSDVINRLVAKIFSSEKCLGNDRKNKLLVRNAVITSAVSELQTTGTPLPQKRRSNSNDEYTYLVYFATTRVPNLSGIRSEDQAKGIYHFDIGANSGLVKNISFSKNEQKYVKETRFERDGVDGLGQLREAYDITIQMYGNIQLYPGMYIFINPIGISPSLGNPTVKSNLSHLLGLGGYHMITKVDSIIAEGQFDTTITAKWVSSGAKAESGEGEDPSDTDNCGVEEIDGAAARASTDE